MHPPDEVWQIFGRHLIRYRDAGLAVDASQGPGWFAVLTGLPDIELNVAGLHRPAGAAETAAVIDRIDHATTHSLVFLSPGAKIAAAPILTQRGFAPTTLPEPLMWRAGAAAPPGADSSFAVRRIADEGDLAGMVAILQAAITMAPDVARRQFALERLAGDGLGSWVAWDGEEPVSAVTLSWDDDACGVWEMMTAPARRRRGAGRAVLSAALAATLQPSMAGTVLVSTPLGRPMYESLGFAALDESITWTRGASTEDLARVGQTPGGAS